MLLKGELGRKSSSVRCLDAHVSLVSKLNSRLERENGEKKRVIATLRLHSHETVGKGTHSIFCSTRTSRTILNNISSIHDEFKIEGIRLSFHACVVE